MDEKIDRLLIQLSEDTEVRIHIMDTIQNSFIDIRGNKKIPFPGYTLYAICKCFIIEFELSFCNFMSEDIDQFYYNGKRIAFYERISEVAEENVKECMEKGCMIEMYALAEFIRRVKLVNGVWCLGFED